MAGYSIGDNEKIGLNMNNYDIFLSYSWNDEAIANEIDSTFSFYGISLFRDVRDLKYKQSIRDFMNKVRSTDYVIMIITENYLKSRNCMYEVVEFIKDDAFKDRILPFIHQGSDIFTAEGKIKYLDYWNNAYKDLQDKIELLDNTESIPLITELRQYGRIKAEIVEFLDVVADLNSIVFDTTIKENLMKKAFDYLGITSYETVKFVIIIKINKKVGLDGIEEEFKNVPQIISNYEKHRYDKDRYEYHLYVNINVDVRELEEIIENKLSKFGAIIRDLFKYDDSYLILSKEKTDIYNSNTLIWWKPFSNGYTEEVDKAGLYSSKEVKKYIYRESGFEDHSVLGIPKRMVDDGINLRIVPDTYKYRDFFSKKRQYLIGDDNWEKKDYYRTNGIPRYKLFNQDEIIES